MTYKLDNLGNWKYFWDEKDLFNMESDSKVLNALNNIKTF